MKRIALKTGATLAGLVGLLSLSAQAAITISEVSSWSSTAANSPYAADWFELTNTGSSAVNISGWKVDDNSNLFTSALALNDVTTIASGQSVVFIEGTSAIDASFINTWFGTTPPVGLTIGHYSGAGIGLSQNGDAVNIYNASGVLQANVTFAAADAVAPLQTFDNAAGLNNSAVSLLSVAGVNGAFVAANDLNEIGSPGSIAPVPEPAEYAMMLAGLALVGGIARRRANLFN